VKVFASEDRSAMKDHPAYRLVHDEANPWTSAEALRVELTADALMHGNGFALVVTLLHKSADVLTTPIPGQTYPTTFVTGMPRAVKPFRTATRTWNSAT
jgi:phage portal protein BeeE